MIIVMIIYNYDYDYIDDCYVNLVYLCNLVENNEINIQKCNTSINGGCSQHR